ncbi:uncharacterized protein LOC135368883 [Ornithodoros turicata]|uniref:uncharacterized protein LOC135368883 n=1 Tax=Ornithodoros turicata TaxID=34597 RepID=UPI003139F3C0
MTAFGARLFSTTRSDTMCYNVQRTELPRFIASAFLLLWAIVPAADGGIIAATPIWSAVSSYYIADVSLPNRFLPGPQYCPDTGRTLCTHVDRYPAERIYDVLMSSKAKHFNLSSLFVDEREGDAEPNLSSVPPRRDSYIVYQTAVHYNFPPVLPPAFVYHKRGLAKRATEDVEAACPVRTMYISPRAALNDRSLWKFVVNVPERDVRVRQVIRVDICQSPETPCSNAISLPFGYVSKCRQKYLKKKLLSLDADGGGTSEENFFVPSCCVCQLVREDIKK